MSISARVLLWLQFNCLQTRLLQAAQCISARWAVREDYFSHASQWRGWAPLYCTKARRKRGREIEKGTETHREKRRKCIFERVDFSRAPMLEHSSELALVQSLYANSMRCPSSAAGISVRNEDLSLRYVGVGPSFKSGLAFVEQPLLDCLFVWAGYCHRMYCFQLRYFSVLCSLFI